MKFNVESKYWKIKELREFIEDTLEDLDEGKRLKLDLDLLDELLFETKDEYKFVAWSGSFLKKLDLSEVNFDGVCWSCKGINVDLSYSNANIDFAKAHSNAICNCNFSHMDLARSSVDTLLCIEDCDLSYCKGINQLFREEKRLHCSIIDTNLEGTNLSRSSICLGDYCVLLRNVNLCNTALNIQPMESAQKDKLIHLGLQIKRGYLGGCYYNGKYIPTTKELEIKKRTRKKEYTEYTRSVIEEIKEDIEQKIKLLNKNA